MVSGIGGERVCLRYAKMNKGESTAVEGSVGAVVVCFLLSRITQDGLGGFMGHDTRAFQLRHAAVGVI